MSGATKVKYTIVTRHLNEAAYNSYAAGRPKTAALRTSITSEATATEATPAPTGSFFFAILQNTSENTNHGQHNQQQQ